MRKILLLLILLGSCGIGWDVAWGQTTAKRFSWVQVKESNPWVPRDSSGELVYRDKMWLIGGWPGSMRDVWSSADGANWKQATPEAPWIHCDLPTSLVYQDKMWMIGGWSGGRKPTASASNKVWCSTDGAKWECTAPDAPWAARIGAGGVVFDGKMWLLGGVQKYFGGEKYLLNDIWTSTDGASWRQVTAHAPWAPRAYHAALVFDGKIWVYGGGNYWPKYLGYNDVWNSSDGIHWTKVTDHAPWSARIWFSSVVYRNRIWLLGGWSNNPSRNWNDVWYSSDGADWKELPTDKVWSKRHEQSAYVFKDKIWIVAGNPWPITNDVWQLEIPESWFERQKR